MVIGQEKICNLIQSATLDDFPRSLMLVGAKGGGKHLICKYIADKFGLITVDLTDQLDLETIEELYNRVEPYLYIIRVNEISVKEENTILKFLEEPLKNSFIVLIAETDMGILQTILNRCQIWHLQNYTREYLSTFISGGSEYILEIANTPGQVIELSKTDFSSMIELADKIIDKISVASITNTLTLSNKVGFKNDPDKPDVKLFVDVLLSRFASRCKQYNDRRLVSGYHLTNTLQRNLQIKNLDYRALFENYLIELRSLMKEAVL